MIIHWCKTGQVSACAELDDGTIVRCHDYESAARAADARDSEPIRARLGSGSTRISAAQARELARAQVEAVEAHIGNAERTADALVRAWLAREEPHVTRGELVATSSETPEQRDDRVRANHGVRTIASHGHPALSAALLRRGWIVLFATRGVWALYPSAEACLWLLALDLFEALQCASRWGDVLARPREATVDVYAAMLEAWRKAANE